MTQRTHPAPSQPFLLDAEAHHADTGAWFVYLFALADCAAFKVGFTCNPLQRISTFTRRYFERFDLSQSLLFNVQACDSARALERTLKLALAMHRHAAPEWVPIEAGGHTEWFSAYFGDAAALARSTRPPRDREIATCAYDFLRVELERVAASFERWAFAQAQRVLDERAAARRGYTVRDQSHHGLRDWLDAYRYFDLALFAEEPEVGRYVRSAC